MCPLRAGRLRNERNDLMSKLDIISYDDFKEKIAGPEPVLVDFYAVWCGPCKMTAPIIENIAAEAQGFKVYKVDVDNLPEAAAAYGVSSIPTIISFVGGKEHARHVGYGDKNTLLALLK